jgi:hypothetical protein
MAKAKLFIKSKKFIYSLFTNCLKDSAYCHMEQDSAGLV